MAAQVLSKSVAIALRETGKEDVTGIAKFCEMMNGFYDCTNVRSLTEHVRKKNAFTKPYESAEDERLTWLKDVFLKYLESWKQSTLEREGEYTPDERQKMFLSVQTYEGLKIAVFLILMQLDSFYRKDLNLFFLRDLCKMSLTTTLDTRWTKAEDQILPQ